MKYNSRIIAVIRCVLFAVMGCLFLIYAGNMNSPVLARIIGVLSLAWAGWILSALLRGRSF